MNQHANPENDRWSSQLISNGAKRYLTAAQKLTSDPLKGEQPFWFCACQSIELSLKSFLRAKGLTKEMLKSNEMGHRLDHLLNEAEIYGFKETVPLSNEERRIIMHCGEMYAKKAFQYSEAGWSELPYAYQILAIAEKIFSGTRPTAESGRTFHHGKASSVL